MIGSRRKTEIIFEALRREGFSEEEIKTIHAPIGLAINAQTPEEIAISIIAELIQVRGEGRVKTENLDGLGKFGVGGTRSIYQIFLDIFTVSFLL